MRRNNVLKSRRVRLAFILFVIVLAGCNRSQPTPAAGASFGNTYVSQVLDTSYPGALNAASQLMLGTLRLEGAENAVTPEQAKTLLVLWQALWAGRCNPTPSGTPPWPTSKRK